MNPETAEILIIGAGAAGLMAARELSRAGKKVTIIEARDRIGGRIYSLDEKVFGYPAQGGAEWIHGTAPISKAIAHEAGLTLIPEDGEIWSIRDGAFLLHKSFIQDNPTLKSRLENLTEDISVYDFLEQNFENEKDAAFKNSILKMVEGYDAADPKLISTFELRDEWLSKPSLTQIANDHRIKEGYGGLVFFLKQECEKYGVKIILNTPVEGIDYGSELVKVFTKNGVWETPRTIVTVPLPLLKEIKFNPPIQDKIVAVEKIGFGNAIKVIMKFKTRFWENATENDLSKMTFLLCNEKFLTWWTQYPEINNVLTGWMAGPAALEYKNATSEELLDLALVTLSDIFKIKKEEIKLQLVTSQSVNWPRDPFARGSYSYTAFYTKDAYEKVVKPIGDKISFAGEALYEGEDASTATVEGALGSGKEVAAKILNNL